MESRTCTCPTCSKQFIVSNPKSRQEFCSPACRPKKKKLLPEAICTVCAASFVPNNLGQKTCSAKCRGIAIGKGRHVEYRKICPTCGILFEAKKHSQYCSHDCYANRNEDVKKVCLHCGTSFTVAYRFREQKFCSISCSSKRTGTLRSVENNIQKTCLCCSKKYVTVASNTTKYCSYTCFMEHKYGKTSETVKLKCEGCGEEFEKPFTARHTRFCSKSCGLSGQNNGMFGQVGYWRGKPAWNRGLSAKTDERLRLTGEKISAIIADKFVNGEWNHQAGYVGEHFAGTKNGGVVSYMRSSYESKFVRLLELDASVLSWEHEPCRIPYEFEGSMKNYVPDFLVYKDDGSVELVEIKPRNLVKEAKNVAKSRAAEAWCESNKINFRIVVESDLE